MVSSIVQAWYVAGRSAAGVGVGARGRSCAARRADTAGVRRARSPRARPHLVPKTGYLLTCLNTYSPYGQPIFELLRHNAISVHTYL